MKLSVSFWGSNVREIEEEGDKALILRVPFVEDERRGDRACPRDLLGWGYSRRKIGPVPETSWFGSIAQEDVACPQHLLI